MNHIAESVLSQKVKVIPVLTYSRVSGYYNPTINFNKGKREEFKERIYIDIKKALNYKGDYNNAQSNNKNRLL